MDRVRYVARLIPGWMIELLVGVVLRKPWKGRAMERWKPHQRLTVEIFSLFLARSSHVLEDLAQHAVAVWVQPLCLGIGGERRRRAVGGAFHALLMMMVLLLEHSADHPTIFLVCSFFHQASRLDHQEEIRTQASRLYRQALKPYCIRWVGSSCRSDRRACTHA